MTKTVATPEYVHEVVTPTGEIPRKTVYRSIVVGDHVLRIASWGKKIGRTTTGAPKHEKSVLQAVLHPKEPGKCSFLDELRKSGKLKQLLEVGWLPMRKNVQYLPCPICGATNPVKGVTRIKCTKCKANLLAVRIKKK